MAWSSSDGSKRVSRTWNCCSWERDDMLDGEGSADGMLAVWAVIAPSFTEHRELWYLMAFEYAVAYRGDPFPASALSVLPNWP